MSFVYIVIEHSDNVLPENSVFPTTYTTFDEAKAAAIERYKDYIHQQIEEGADETEIMKTLHVPETEPPPDRDGVIGTVRANLYVEKEINMYIHKLPVKISGARRSKSNTRRRKIKLV